MWKETKEDKIMMLIIRWSDYDEDGELRGVVVVVQS